jgi:hypothetical protein
MTDDTKTKARAKAAPATTSAAAPVVRRDEALRVAAGLTEAERDLVSGIVDWQIEGLDDDLDPRG